jgi:enterochelin esterase family protein
MKKKHFALLLFLVSYISLYGQAFSTEGWWSPETQKYSPVVTADGQITFRTSAPNAKEVKLVFGEWDVQPVNMHKNDKGDWEITIGPVIPGVYEYKFDIDGLKVLDYKNPLVKAGTEVYGSVVEVCASVPRFDQYVHAGSEVDVISYISTSLSQRRKVYVYIPAVYYENPEIRLPVLYLRHGGGDDESSWIRSASADAIMDNLIAGGNAEPMIVVMTNGLTDGSWAGGSNVEGMRALEEELLNDVIPLVEKRYRVLTDRKSRAIAGLSMGGGQAFVIGMRHLELFSAIGEFSSGLLSDSSWDYSKYGIASIDDSVKVNSMLSLLWVSCGTKDSRWEGHKEFCRLLDRKGIRHTFRHSEHGHEWQFWREQLRDFATALFH